MVSAIPADRALPSVLRRGRYGITIHAHSTGEGWIGRETQDGDPARWPRHYQATPIPDGSPLSDRDREISSAVMSAMEGCGASDAVARRDQRRQALAAAGWLGAWPSYGPWTTADQEAEASIRRFSSEGPSERRSTTGGYNASGRVGLRSVPKIRQTELRVSLSSPGDLQTPQRYDRQDPTLFSIHLACSSFFFNVIGFSQRDSSWGLASDLLQWVKRSGIDRPGYPVTGFRDRGPRPHAVRSEPATAEVQPSAVIERRLVPRAISRRTTRSATRGGRSGSWLESEAEHARAERARPEVEDGPQPEAEAESAEARRVTGNCSPRLGPWPALRRGVESPASEGPRRLHLGGRFFFSYPWSMSHLAGCRRLTARRAQCPSSSF